MSGKERPILFSAPMVRALLAGTKTQTRRTIKIRGVELYDHAVHGPRYREVDRDGLVCGGGPFDPKDWLARCPYGVPGDTLWVRETWQAQQHFDWASPTQIGEAFAEEHGDPWCPIRYVSDGKCEGSVEQWQESPLGKTRVSIHMPRWASRLSLRITDVRVERLNEISEADAFAEGVVLADGGGCEVIGVDALWQPTARGAYRVLWERINGDGSWAENPWVWVVSFEIIHSPIGASPTERQPEPRETLND